jgi:hypothetical protein
MSEKNAVASVAKLIARRLKRRRQSNRYAPEEPRRKKYLRQHVEASREQAFEACKKEHFKGGLHLAPKDLRDYFCTEIAARSNDD